MVPRLAGVAALLLAATTVLAQAKQIKLEFPSEGPREVWIQEKGKEGTIPDRTPVSGKAVEIEAPTEAEGKTVYVRDVKTGNVATRALDQVVESGAWKVSTEDETHAYSMVFLVAHDEKPVSSAIVTMRIGDAERQTLVTEADDGLAGFYVVPFGDVSVSVTYETDGLDKTLPSQVFESKPGMAESGPIPLSIEDEVATVAPPQDEPEPEAKGTTEEREEPEEEPARTSPFSTILNMIIGLAVVGGIAYAVWRYVKANPDQTADALQKAGVQVPGDPGVAPVSPKKAGPPQQILLGDAAPEPATPTVAAAPAVKNPRLVKSDGSLFIVQEGEQTVGRENAALTLAGESSVSRTHAKLTRTGDSVVVEDAGSTNGTFVNGQRVGGPQALNPGDTVQFGAVQYRYEE